MKKKWFSASLAVLVLFVVSCFTTPAWAEKKTGVDSAANAQMQETYGKLPLYFIKNEGQLDKDVKYYEKASGHATFFTEEGIYLSLTKKDKLSNQTKDRPKRLTKKKQVGIKSEVIKLMALNSNKNPKIIAEDMQAGKVNYLIGNDKSKWKTNIPTYKALRYKNIYPGVDIRFYGNNQQLEYDVIVAPKADLSKIKFGYEGITALKTTHEGNLEIVLSQGSILQKSPYIYQVINGKKQQIEGRFVVGTKQGSDFFYSFEVAAYNRQYPLIIDPVLSYSTYLGGASADWGSGIAVDATGAAYIVGSTYSTDFPTVNPIQAANTGYYDAFITKIDPSGSAIAYSTYFGGSESDGGEAVAVDNTGRVYITGRTAYTDFPMVNPIQATHSGGYWDVFVTKINSSGSAVLFSTYLGGTDSDEGYAMALDASGAVYVTGYTLSTDFPTLSAIQPVYGGGYYDAFITKIDTVGFAIAYSTFLGGSGADGAAGVAVDNTGAAYITGYTQSTDFPTQNPIQGTFGGTDDAFVTKINPAGAAITYSTYLGGGNSDWAAGIAVDNTGAAYVAGQTRSIDFPTLNPIQGAFGGGYDDGFVTKINPAGSAVSYSTYLGAGDSDWAAAIAVDNTGAAYVTGITSSADFPTVNAIQAVIGGYYDAFVIKIEPAGSAIDFSSYLGGRRDDEGHAIAVDNTANIYLTGRTRSADFPTQNPIQARNAGGADGFVVKISESYIPPGKLGIKQFYTEDAGGNWDFAFAPNDTIELKSGIRIDGASGGLYDLQVRYFLTDSAGKNTLLGKLLYKDYAPGDYYVSLSASIPPNAALGDGIIRVITMLADGSVLVDRAVLGGFVVIE